MIRKSDLHKAIVILLVAIPVLTFLISDKFSEWAVTANPLTVIIIAMTVSPSFIILMWLSYDKWKWKGVIAVALVAFMSSVIDLPHAIKNPIINHNATMPVDGQLYLTTDGGLYRLITHATSGMQVSLSGYTLTYIIVPLLIVGLVIYIFGWKFVEGGLN